MDSSQKAWLYTSGIFSILIAVLSINAAIFWQGQEARIVEMVVSGANPIEASCALNDVYGRNPNCIVLTTKK